LTAADLEDPEPVSFQEALQLPEASAWIQACMEELEGLDAMHTWSLVDKPANCNVLPVKWVFKQKRDQDGIVIRHKARLVAKGFRQKHGIDYGEIFAPVASAASFRTLMAAVATNGWAVRQIDFKQAFLNGTLDEVVYIQQPEGFEDGTGRVLLLHKSLYGLKQAPRAWHETLKAALLQLGYVQSAADAGVFMKDGNWLLLYVDDQLVIGPSVPVLQSIIAEIAGRFEITDMGVAQFYLGVDVSITPGRVALSQRRYIRDLLRKFPSPDKPVRPVTVPAVPRREDSSMLLQDFVPFARIVGALMYLAVWTRPDISNATQRLSKVLACPTEDDLSAAYRILNYLEHSQDQELVYSSGVHPLLEAYCDSDYASDALSVPPRRSVSGVVFFMAGGPIMWTSKQQPTVALSTCEAEYMAAAVAARDALWLRKLLPELGFPVDGPFSINCDNKGAIELLKNPICSSKAKHIDTIHHFARERVAMKQIAFTYVESHLNAADILTKPLAKAEFEFQRAKLLQQRPAC
jgi:hypothetical protein